VPPGHGGDPLLSLHLDRYRAPSAALVDLWADGQGPSPLGRTSTGSTDHEPYRVHPFGCRRRRLLSTVGLDFIWHGGDLRLFLAFRNRYGYLNLDICVRSVGWRRGARQCGQVGSTGPGPGGGRGPGGDLFLRQVGLPGIHEVWDHLPGAPTVGGGGARNTARDRFLIHQGGRSIPIRSGPGPLPPTLLSAESPVFVALAFLISHRAALLATEAHSPAGERKRGGACSGGAPGPVVFPLLVGCSVSVG